MKNMSILSLTFMFVIGTSAYFPMVLLSLRGIDGVFLFSCISETTFKMLFGLVFVSIFLVGTKLHLSTKTRFMFALGFSFLAMSLVLNDLIQVYEDAFVRKLIYDNIGSPKVVILYTGILFSLACLLLFFAFRQDNSK